MSIKGLSCIFPVPNIKKTEEFYMSCLGFRALEYLECKEPHICLYKDKNLRKWNLLIQPLRIDNIKSKDKNATCVATHARAGR